MLEAVRLELKVDGELISFPRILLRQPAHSTFDPGQLLDVVAELVGENVGLGKVSRVSAHSLQIVPEAEIDVDLFVSWTIERSGCGLGGTAAGVSGIAKEDELGVAVGQTLSGKDLCPRLLSVIEDKAD